MTYKNINTELRFGCTKLKTTYQIPPNYEVDAIWDGQCVRYEWTPDVPHRRWAKKKKFQKAFAAALKDFHTDIAALEGEQCFVIDSLTRKVMVIDPPLKN